MSILDNLKNCKSCAERREVMKNWMADFMTWTKNPLGPPPPGMMPPTNVVLPSPPPPLTPEEAAAQKIDKQRVGL